MARIIRKYQDDSRADEVIGTDLSVEDAKEHCNLPSSRGEGWFDVFYLDDGDHDL